MLREFAKNIVTIRAQSGGKAVVLEKLDKSTWRGEPCGAPLEIEYEVYAWDLSVRTAHLDNTHGYFNGTSLFLQVHGQEDKPCEVELCPPPKIISNRWRVATTLGRNGAELWQFGCYKAENYDDLIDHPVEMGEFDVVSFESGGRSHDVVLSGKHNADTARIATDLKRICDTHIKMFGELPDIERYLFLVWIVGDGYGGLEHRASTSLLVNRADLPIKGKTEVTDNYRQFLGLCSHEYFHTWNVKRIKPEGFLPYQLASESYTRQLWAYEGITSYYDDLGVVRSGCIDGQSYLNALAQTITRVLRGSGRLKQSVADSSFDAWTKFYRQDENAPNAIVSYYTKGSLIALALDLTIRANTQGERSLDDLMRLLWCDYGKQSRGTREGEIESLASQVAGCDLSEFFERYLHGVEDLTLNQLLAEVGVEFRLRAAESNQDKGGNPSLTPSDELKARPELGIRTVAENGSLKVANVFDGGTAIKAGVAAGDILVACEGMRLTVSNLDDLLGMYAVGDQITIHLFRGDLLLEFRVALQAPPEDTVDLILVEKPNEAVLARRQAWLGA